MENEFNTTFLESYAMNGGEGPHSYAQNSHIQRKAIEAAKNFLQSAIFKYFDPKAVCTPSTNLICIADLGCSTGPNTFIAMQNIIEAILLQYQSQNLCTPELQIFFNDQVSNDFNTLFQKLPPNRNYFATGVPGSFCGRLFPRKSLHLVHSSASLHWMSELPKELMDRNCGAWNKGRIHYAGAPREVREAYERQYKIEFESFLHARAQEIANNGIMALQIPASHDVIDVNEELYPGKDLELLGTCLTDMAREGLVSEEKVDTFNVPLFFLPIKDMMKILESNEDFSMEQMEIVECNKELLVVPNVEMYVSTRRATLEGLIEKHFGEGIVDELFLRYTKKVTEFPEILDIQKLKIVLIFVILKLKVHA